nr:hypothetical protein pPsy0462a_00034 [Pseudomonas syringae]
MPARYAAPRHLSEQQLKNPLIRSAYERLSNMDSYRGQYLRRLDGVHGDRRTRREKFLAIERVAEQLLVRLDLATSVLGYIDPANGRYVPEHSVWHCRGCGHLCTGAVSPDENLG